jgi:Sec-independent protein translocase protein TatA
MAGPCVLAFMNLGWTEMVVVAVVALLLFGPQLGRTLGQVGGTMLKLKRGVDGAKHGLTSTIAKQLEEVVTGPAKPVKKPAEKPEPEMKPQPPESNSPSAEG